MKYLVATDFSSSAKKASQFLQNFSNQVPGEISFFTNYFDPINLSNFSIEEKKMLQPLLKNKEDCQTAFLEWSKDLSLPPSAKYISKSGDLQNLLLELYQDNIFDILVHF